MSESRAQDAHQARAPKQSIPPGVSHTTTTAEARSEEGGMDAGSARTEAGGTLASREPGEPGGLKTLRVSFFGFTVPGGLTEGGAVGG